MSPLDHRVLAVIPILIFAHAYPANAGGDYYSRVVDQSFPSACDGGSVIESYATGANIHGFWHTYALACLRGKDHATWVIRSGTTCYDSAEDPKVNNGLCSNQLVNLLPSFDNSGEFWSQKTPPFTMRYRMIRYGLGKNCTRMDQPVHYEPKSFADQDSIRSLWSCESLNIVDGSLDASGVPIDKPFRFNTREFVTISSKMMQSVPFPVEQNLPLNPMLDFLLPSTRYECEVGYLSSFGKKTLVCESK